MNKTFTALAAAAAMLGASAAQAAIVVSFNPTKAQIAIGEALDVEVNISGLTGEILSAVDLNVLFSGAAASRTGADFSGLLAALEVGQPGMADLLNDVNTAGDYGIQAYSLLDDFDLEQAPQPDTFLLGKFSLVGAANGVTRIGFGSDPDFQRNFIGSNFTSLNVTVGTSCVAVGTGTCDQQNVPEPASFGLAGLALLAAGLAGRRRRAVR